MSTSSYLELLNTQQYAAVTAPLVPVRVIAGAGSGKTRVLTSRIAWLMGQHHASHHSILTVTFTNKAAREMRERLSELLGYGLHGMWIGTFHSLCHRFLQQHSELAKLPKGFQVLDSDDQLRLCKRLLKTQSIDEKILNGKTLAHFITHHKDQGRRPQHIEHYQRRELLQLIELYQQYEAICHQNGVVDFAELLLRSVELLRDHHELCTYYQQRFSDILVDEFQDTNEVQYAWLRLLAGGNARLFVVGDNDQSIYAWRGARIDNILNFDQDYPNSQTFPLEQNYRSSTAILNTANQIIAHNPQPLPKKLWSAQTTGQPVTFYCATDDYDEARFVTEKMHQLHIEEGFPWKEMAILYRTNSQSRVFEEMLVQRQIPHRVYAGLRFYDRAEIKDVLAYLRIAVNPHDDLSLERALAVPPKGIGTTSMDQLRLAASSQQCSLWGVILKALESGSLRPALRNALTQFVTHIQSLQHALSTQSLAEFVETCLQTSQLETHYAQQTDGRAEDRLENIAEFKNAIGSFLQHMNQELLNTEAVDEALRTTRYLEVFLANVTLDSSDHQAGAHSDCVQLMTLHAAKGLEFESVFLVGMEEGLFPSESRIMAGEGLEEERRLAYVGITRAKQILFLTAAEQRLRYGKTVRFGVSRFIREIDEAHLKTIGPAIQIYRPVTQRQPTISKSAQSKPVQCEFNLGQNVHHEKFGNGVITAFEGDHPHLRVKIRFKGHGEKILVLQYARLQPLSV